MLSVSSLKDTLFMNYSAMLCKNTLLNEIHLNTSLVEHTENMRQQGMRIYSDPIKVHLDHGAIVLDVWCSCR